MRQTFFRVAAVTCVSYFTVLAANDLLAQGGYGSAPGGARFRCSTCGTPFSHPPCPACMAKRAQIEQARDRKQEQQRKEEQQRIDAQRQSLHEQRAQEHDRLREQEMQQFQQNLKHQREQAESDRRRSEATAKAVSLFAVIGSIISSFVIAIRWNSSSKRKRRGRETRYSSPRATQEPTIGLPPTDPPIGPPVPPAAEAGPAPAGQKLPPVRRPSRLPPRRRPPQ